MASKRKRRDDDAGDERPWNEARWEREFRESDVRADRFGELLETLMDHPDRDAIIAREMGWEGFAEALEAQKEGRELDADDDDDDDDEAEVEVEAEDDTTSGDDEAEEDFDPNQIMAEAQAEYEAERAERERLGLPEPDPFEEEDRELQQIPAYVTCQRCAERVMELLKPFQSERDEDRDEHTGDLIGQAFIGIQIACVKMAGGHTMGYDDDMLCGNIVKNKQSLEGARQSIRAFEELRGLDVLPAKAIDDLLPELREAERAVAARIEELRAKVWWD